MLAFITSDSLVSGDEAASELFLKFEFDAENKSPMQKFDCTAGWQEGSLNRKMDYKNNQSSRCQKTNNCKNLKLFERRKTNKKLAAWVE